MRKRSLDVCCTFQNCSVVNGQAILCYTVPGVGTNLVWVVTYNGVPLVNGSGTYVSTMSYNPPSSLQLSTTADIPTNAQSALTLTLTGVDLYPDCAVVQVMVGKWRWTPVRCDYDVVVCVTSSGAGGALPVSVWVGGTVGTLSTFVWYVGPTIASVTGPRLVTYGGSVVTVQGLSFGPVDATLSVSYSGGSDGRVYAASCTRQFSTPTVDQLQCVTPAGVGHGHVWTVCVENQCSDPSGDTTAYAEPTITSISGMVCVCLCV